jgi:hypothetical protein
MNCLKEYIEIFDSFSPGLADEWEEDDLWNSGNETPLHSLFLFYSHFVAERLNDVSLVNREKLFAYIESIMLSNDRNARDAAATCFLENLLHVSGVKFDKQIFFPYLGSESIEFLKTWDDFNNVKTDGLW